MQIISSTCVEMFYIITEKNKLFNTANKVSNKNTFYLPEQHPYLLFELLLFQLWIID